MTLRTQQAQIEAAITALRDPHARQRAMTQAATDVAILTDTSGPVYLTRIDADLHGLEGDQWSAMFSTSAPAGTAETLLRAVDLSDPRTRPTGKDAAQAAAELTLILNTTGGHDLARATQGAHTGQGALLLDPTTQEVLVSAQHVSGALYRLQGRTWTLPYITGAQPGTLRRMMQWHAIKLTRLADPAHLN